MGRAWKPEKAADAMHKAIIIFVAVPRHTQAAVIATARCEVVPPDGDYHLDTKSKSHRPN